jgi:hypothetical protein
MQRRKFIAGVGSLAAGAAAVTGTGAFTSVSADRTLSIQTDGDADAFLSIERARDSNGDITPNAAEYVEGNQNNGTLSLDFTNVDDTSASAAGGINENATTIFDNLLDVTNNGTQEVNFWIETDLVASNGGSLGIYAENSQDDPSDNVGFDYPGDGSYPESSDQVTLSPGKSATNIGVYVPEGNAVDSISGGTLTFKAVRTGGNQD